MRARTAASSSRSGLAPAMAPVAVFFFFLLAAMGTVLRGCGRESTPAIARIFVEHLLADRAIGVDEGVGVFAARLVEQVRDVQLRGGEAGGDLSDHVRHVAVGDREPRGVGYARQHRFRVVDAVPDIAVLEEIAQLFGHHDGAVLLGLAGGGAQVRQRDHLRVVLEGDVGKSHT